jgi:hypothetical protein
MDEITVIPASHEDWAGLVRRAAEPDGHEARVVLEVHQRLLAVEARLPWVGTAADVAPQVVPTTTADGLSPVEPAPQALQGVTVEELIQSLPPNFRDAQAYKWAVARASYLQHGHASPAPAGPTPKELVDCLPNSWTGDLDSFARYLFDHPRIGPLLRGEGAPGQSPVVLPEEPPLPTAVVSGLIGEFYLNGYRDAWAKAYRMVARQQGGQADG